MNKVYLAVAVLILFPLFAWGYLIYTESNCRELTKAVELAEENADAENAESYFKAAEKKWNKIEKVIAISAHHSLVEEINESFTKAKVWQELDEKNLYVSELRWLNKLIRHVYETEKPEAYNIF